nr:histone-lysine N-methyltransferase SETMAR-like [Haemonchus contortus]
MHSTTLVPKVRAGNTSFEDEPHGSRPPTLDNDQLKASVEADPHKTTRDIAKELNVHHTTIVRHLKQIGKTKKLDKWVPHELTVSQKNRRFEIPSAHLLRNASDPFLERIVTCDEKWILYDNRRRSAQWLDQKEAPRHHYQVLVDGCHVVRLRSWCCRHGTFGTNVATLYCAFVHTSLAPNFVDISSGLSGSPTQFEL